MAISSVDLSAGLAPKPIDLSAGLVPKSQPDATPKEGFWHSLATNLGIDPDAPPQSVKDAIANALKPANLARAAAGPAGQVVEGAYQGVKRSGSELYQAAKDAFNNNRAGATYHATKAIPIVGPGLDKAADQHAEGNTAGELGTLLGTTLQVAPMVLGATDAAFPNRPTVSTLGAVDAAADAAAKLKNRVYPTSQSLTPEQTAARNLGKALVVPVKAMPNFIEAATEEAGTIKGYAQSNNLPINSTVDLANAAEATAKAVQDHFNNEILAPNEKDVVSVPPDYRGTKLNVEGKRATLGDVNNRINAINQELNQNFRQATTGQTNAANVSDADLIAEKRKLTNLLHNTLADKTGLEPEDIAALRQKAGKLRTIADEVRLSANTNTTAAGKAAMGRSDIPTGTKLGIAERLLQAVQGGPEIIGNRAVNRALKGVNPTELSLPEASPIDQSEGNAAPQQGPSPQIIQPQFGEQLQDYLRRRQAAARARQ